MYEYQIMIEIGFTKQHKICIVLFAINDKMNYGKYFISKLLSSFAIVHEKKNWFRCWTTLKIIWQFETADSLKNDYARGVWNLKHFLFLLVFSVCPCSEIWLMGRELWWNTFLRDFVMFLKLSGHLLYTWNCFIRNFSCYSYRVHINK